MKRLGRLAALTAALTALAATGVAAAASLTGGGSSILVSQTLVSARTAGGNTIVELDASRILTGALSGTLEEHFRNVIHPNGVITVKGSGTFTGTLDGCGPDVLTIPFTVTAHVTPAGELTAHFTSTGGRPNFVGTASGSAASPVLSYEAAYRC